MSETLTQPETAKQSPRLEFVDDPKSPDSLPRQMVIMHGVKVGYVEWPFGHGDYHAYLDVPRSELGLIQGWGPTKECAVAMAFHNGLLQAEEHLRLTREFAERFNR